MGVILTGVFLTVVYVLGILVFGYGAWAALFLFLYPDSRMTGVESKMGNRVLALILFLPFSSLVFGLAKRLVKLFIRDQNEAELNQVIEDLLRCIDKKSLRKLEDMSVSFY